MISKAKTVDGFLAGLPEAERAVFAQVQAMFKGTTSCIEETMQYGMPTYSIGGAMVGAFNRQKHYLCVYANPDAIAPHRRALGLLDCGKSCIRFRRPEDLPLPVVRKIIRAAAKLARIG